ncbi:MAG: PIN domain-containing protein [Acidobacteriota bacterium]|nr:PIN domain-containing protein [Acidobacteriota bacterium]
MADVNVLLALLVRQHEHHKAALKWFEHLSADEAGLCRVVQLALIRLLGNRHIMGDDAVPAGTAWRLIEELSQDERVRFVSEPERLDSIFPGLLNSPVPTGKLIGDAYLAAFSIAASLRMITLDRGFRQFKDLDVEILRR